MSFSVCTVTASKLLANCSLPLLPYPGGSGATVEGLLVVFNWQACL
jgi:hypothetical protein